MRVRLYLTKLVTWSNRDKDWKNANSLFQRHFHCLRRPRILRSLLGSLGNNDGDGYENVTQKVKSRCFKLYRAYSFSFNSSNVDNFLWIWILKDCIEVQKKKKREIRYFHVVVVQRRQRNVQKSVMHVQSCCFANLNLLLFCRSHCRRRRRCLSSLMFLVLHLTSQIFEYPECSHL